MFVYICSYLRNFRFFSYASRNTAPWSCHSTRHSLMPATISDLAPWLRNLINPLHRRMCHTRQPSENSRCATAWHASRHYRERNRCHFHRQLYSFGEQRAQPVGRTLECHPITVGQIQIHRFCIARFFHQDSGQTSLQQFKQFGGCVLHDIL